MTITAQEWELLSFFEAEPKLTDSDRTVPWVYNTAVYSTSAGRFAVCFAISPAYADLTLTVRDGDQIVFQTVALGVEDVRYCKDTGVESLEILVGKKHTVKLVIRPLLRIEQKLGA